MTGPRVGALFAGYGGLDEAVIAVFGGTLAWYSEIDPGACKILEHRFPGVPNIGDITKVDWSTVEPVDILTGGSPCQDLSHAGKRAGMTEGTRSNLWVSMREAIAYLRPQLVIWENVRGAYSAEAASELESNPRLLADTRRRPGQPVLRALGRVFGDLSDIGYVGGWHGLRAADVGAPHGRFRVFVIARDASQSARGGPQQQHLRPAVGSTAELGEPTSPAAAFAADLGHERPREAQDGWTGLADGSLLPTPRATDGTKGGPNQRGSSGDLMLPSAVALLPTPAVNDMGEGKTVEHWDEWTAKMQTVHGNGNGHGKSLAIEAQRLLPSPTTEPMTGNGHARHLGGEIKPDRWGDYAAAIAHWEHTLGRPAPAPTMTSKKGNPQLSPAFVEWLMGLPAGWVTDVPGITRNEALKALGNGVVPQQAEAAVRWLCPVVAGALVAHGSVGSRV